MSSYPLALSQIPPATVGLLGQRELLERVDQKYLCDLKSLQAFVQAIGTAYHMVRVADQPWTRCETRYFDTRELCTFTQHMRGSRPRYKLRIRRYEERNRAFFEIKCKSAGERTDKHRLKVSCDQVELSSRELDFVTEHTPFAGLQLEPSVWTNFDRITLLGVNNNERITIDLGLVFEFRGLQIRVDPDLAIIELKQPHYSHSTPAAYALRALSIRQCSFSKYCAAVALLSEGAHPRYVRLMQSRLSRIKKWKTI